MNTLKLAVLGLGFFVGTAAFAQEQKTELTKEQRMEERMENLSTELELTEVQKAQLIELRKTSYEERQKVRDDESLDQTSRKEAMKAIHQDHKGKMAEILTEEQIQKLELLKDEYRKNHKHSRKKKGMNQKQSKDSKRPATK